MKLYFKKTGSGKPLIILHGLFGLGDNWNTLAKVYAENGFSCYLVDQRNHGRSPHSVEFSFSVMADDILELMEDEGLEQVDLLGHSMGGKTAMFFAQKFPTRLDKLIVADIAPKYYPPHHQTVVAALNSINLETTKSRKEAEEKLRVSLRDEATLQFLLKNLYWKEPEKLEWRFNLEVLSSLADNAGEALPSTIKIKSPTLFVRGEKSGYVTAEDEITIRNLFSDVRIITIQGAGHWVHAEKPKEFLEATLEFLKRDFK